MSGQWKEVVRLHFKGTRYRDHALDLSALKKLGQFQKIVAETAKELWRVANPDRERLPKNFEDRTRLCLRNIEDGSATVPLEIYLEEGEQTSLLESDAKEVEEAIAMAHEVFESVEEQRALPGHFPKTLLPEFTRWVQEIEKDEEIFLAVPGKSELKITDEGINRLIAYSEKPYEDHIEILGEVLEADVKQKKFQLWIDEKTKVLVNFSSEQEEMVTQALKDHKTVKMEVRGLADILQDGKINEIKAVDELKIIKEEETPYDRSSRPIGQILEELGKEVLPGEWEKLPADLSDNLDHYLYGTPKH